MHITRRSESLMQLHPPARAWKHLGNLVGNPMPSLGLPASFATATRPQEAQCGGRQGEQCQERCSEGAPSNPPSSKPSGGKELERGREGGARRRGARRRGGSWGRGGRAGRGRRAERRAPGERARGARREEQGERGQPPAPAPAPAPPARNSSPKVAGREAGAPGWPRAGQLAGDAAQRG
uniref:Collagen alpha-1(I) chain-like n=1 Tax=Castor canadensis TaxID=51338 RepID=A0A8B7VAN3_CASCN|nr:collagen alpha-1(I) chain-like [Castor canadensis]